MKKTLIKLFFKNKYLQVVYYGSDKIRKIYYVKPTKDYLITINSKTYKINSNHIFYTSNGFRSVIVNDLSAETINPLDFESKFNADDFNTAINNNLIKQTFETFSDNQIDWLKVIMFGNLFISAVLLYFILKMNGAL
jgi:hypothetical protein